MVRRMRLVVMLVAATAVCGLFGYLLDHCDPPTGFWQIDTGVARDSVEVLPPVEDWHPELREARPLDDPPKPFAQLAGLSF